MAERAGVGTVAGPHRCVWMILFPCSFITTSSNHDPPSLVLQVHFSYLYSLIWSTGMLQGYMEGCSNKNGPKWHQTHRLGPTWGFLFFSSCFMIVTNIFLAYIGRDIWNSWHGEIWKVVVMKTKQFRCVASSKFLLFFRVLLTFTIIFSYHYFFKGTVTITNVAPTQWMAWDYCTFLFYSLSLLFFLLTIRF